MKHYTTCTVKGCGLKHHAHSYCAKHATRFVRYGDPLVCSNYNRGSGRCVTKVGYVLVYEDGKWEYEHRQVVEKSLGKKLGTREVIHHIDGDKANNKLSNLLVTTPEEHTKIHEPHWNRRIFKCV